LTSRQQLIFVDQALVEASRRLETGGLDASGRRYRDEERAAGAATGGKRTAATPAKTTAV
jgi:hypothetical protein